MTLTTHFSDPAGARPFPYGLGGFESYEVSSDLQPNIAVPFVRTQNWVLSESQLQIAVFLRDQLFAFSSPYAGAALVTVKSVEPSPAELTQEFRRLTGLTWEQMAHVFGVTRRALFDWGSGKPIKAKNQAKLAPAVAAIRYIDRGNSEDNRNLLFSEAVHGQTYLDLLRSAEFDRVRALAGEGAGRPNFGQGLTAEAAKFNAPRHFSESIEAFATGDDSEILPISTPKLRRVKARRNEA